MIRDSPPILEQQTSLQVSTPIPHVEIVQNVIIKRLNMLRINMRLNTHPILKTERAPVRIRVRLCLSDTQVLKLSHQVVSLTIVGGLHVRCPDSLVAIVALSP